jgi:hypothetical protein
MLLSRRNPTIENRQPANHPSITHLRLYTASTRLGHSNCHAAMAGLGLGRVKTLRPRETGDA